MRTPKYRVVCDDCKEEFRVPWTGVTAWAREHAPKCPKYQVPQFDLLASLMTVIAGRELAARTQLSGVARWEALLGTTEDHGILARHSRIRELATVSNQGKEWIFLCSYEWVDGDGHLLRWEECPEIQSLARRYGLGMEHND